MYEQVSSGLCGWYNSAQESVASTKRLDWSRLIVYLKILKSLGLRAIPWNFAQYHSVYFEPSGGGKGGSRASSTPDGTMKKSSSLIINM
jgi:hypothetical protein